MTIFFFQYAFGEFIVENVWISDMSHSHDETFFDVETHLPFILPLLKGD